MVITKDVMTCQANGPTITSCAVDCDYGPNSSMCRTIPKGGFVDCDISDCHIQEAVNQCPDGVCPPGYYCQNGICQGGPETCYGTGQQNCPTGQSCWGSYTGQSGMCVNDYTYSPTTPCLYPASPNVCSNGQYCSSTTGVCTGPCKPGTNFFKSNIGGTTYCYPSCPPGYESAGLTNCSSDNRCDNNCCPAIPAMIGGSQGNIWPCCGINVPSGFTAEGTCAPSFCPNGAGCSSYMSTYCNSFGYDGSSEPQWDPICDTYLTAQGNPIAAAQVVTNIANANSQTPYSPTTPNPFFGLNSTGNTSYAAQYCSQYPGSCNNALANYCSTVTRDDMYNSDGSLNVNLVNTCGCFMQQNTTNYPFLNNSISIECDPICSVASVQKGQFLPNGSWSRLECGETVCIIDDVVLNYINSSGGAVNFSQVCGGNCISGSCSMCYINGVNVNAINSQFQGDLNLSQNCQACSNDSNQPIPCSGSVPPSPSGGGFFNKLMQFVEDHKILTIGGLIALMLLAILILVIASRD
jgi:hypothetical protein